MLDQEGLEVDPLDRLEKETPLHKAVRFINGLPKQEWEGAKALVDLLLDAGADPRLAAAFASDGAVLTRCRVRNKTKQKPISLVDAGNVELKSALERAEYAILAGDDVVNDDDDADGHGGSASDSE